MANSNSVILKVLPEELWWGGMINNPFRMPFPPGARVDLQNMRGNCAMPLLISSQGRFVWSEEPFRFSITGDAITVVSNDPEGALEWGDGYETLRSAFLHTSKAYFPPSGSTPAPLLFTAPQYNTWMEMTYYSTQAKVLAYAEGILEAGFPPGVLIIDSLWHPTYGTWIFDGARYPDPKGMVARLNEMGFRVMVWMVPYVTADTLVFRELRDKGFLFAEPDGRPVIVEWWDGYSAALDVTNPEAVAWLHEQMDWLVNEIGISGFKLDGGQPINYERSGITHAHHVTHAWNQVGLRYAFSEYKDSWKCAGWPLAQRIRDRYHSWDDLEGLGSLIPMGLEQGLLGYTFNCPDMIGGGECQDFPLRRGVNLDEELFVRYAQAAALFPMMQFSAAPWRLLDAKHLEICVDMARLHERMGPEILALAQDSAQTGEPIMRHMAYVYPSYGYETINDQFLLGDDILVAPVVQQGAQTRTVVFPPGTWRGDDGSEVEGPCRMRIEAPLARLPWYRRQGS